MKALTRGVVWWPGMDEDLERKVKCCQPCQVNRKAPPPAPLHLWEWPIRPWSRLHVDFAGSLRGKHHSADGRPLKVARDRRGAHTTSSK